MNTIYAKDKNNQIYIFSNKEELELYSIIELTEITESEAIKCSETGLSSAERTEINIAFLSSETRRVNEAITPLDDAIEFEIATEDEIYRHKELRKYRLFLSRVTTQEGWPQEAAFPEAPEFFK